jgi:hypothetical protein
MNSALYYSTKDFQMDSTQQAITEFTTQQYVYITNNLEKAGGSISVASGGVGLTQWLEENNAWLASVGVIFGIILGAAGYFTNLYFQIKRNKLLESEKGEGKKDEN